MEAVSRPDQGQTIYSLNFFTVVQSIVCELYGVGGGYLPANVLCVNWMVWVVDIYQQMYCNPVA